MALYHYFTPSEQDLRIASARREKRVTNTEEKTIQAAIQHNVEIGSTLHTDEAAAYDGIRLVGFDHETLNHSAGEYVRDDVTANGMESVLAVLKRGLIGVYHHASPKHLDRYVVPSQILTERTDRLSCVG